MTHALRRSGRWPRRVKRLAFEVALIGLAFVWLSGAFSLPGVEEYFPLLLTFLMLRYHLFVNDVSHLTRSLGREQLHHLLLTSLGRNDYFLHPFLYFCWRYRALVGYVAVCGAIEAGAILSGGWHWVKPVYYSKILLGFYLTLLAWVVGVGQYVIEWRLFAGGRARRVQNFLSILLSAFLAVFIVLLPVIPAMKFVQGHYFGGLFSAVIIFLFLGLIVWLTGVSTYRGATEDLWRSFLAGDRESLSSIQAEPGALDLILPWRWPRRPPERLRAFRRSLHLDALQVLRPRVIVWSVVFALFFNIAVEINYSWFWSPQNLGWSIIAGFAVWAAVQVAWAVRHRKRVDLGDFLALQRKPALWILAIWTLLTIAPSMMGMVDSFLDQAFNPAFGLRTIDPKIYLFHPPLHIIRACLSYVVLLSFWIFVTVIVIFHLAIPSWLYLRRPEVWHFLAGGLALGLIWFVINQWWTMLLRLLGRTMHSATYIPVGRGWSGQYFYPQWIQFFGNVLISLVLSVLISSLLCAVGLALLRRVLAGGRREGGASAGRVGGQRE